ncbi:MAG: hypothetical protein WC517_02400 [Patescibacteria group bacterium]
MKAPRPPKPYNLYKIIRRVCDLEMTVVYAHSSIQAVAYYCQGIKAPWREKEFRADLLEEPALRQPKSYRERLLAHNRKLAEYEQRQTKLPG